MEWNGILQWVGLGRRERERRGFATVVHELIIIYNEEMYKETEISGK
jgi:hypothetical protein